MKTNRPLAAAAVAAGLVVAAAGTATADSTTVEDGADASASLHDVLTMTVNHTPQRVVVRTTYADLQRHSDAGPAGTTIYLDTKPKRKGPEFALTSGLQDGTDYQLVRVKKWKLKDKPVDCAHGFKVRWKKDVTRLRVGRSCIGAPARVRVAQKMVDAYDGSHPVTDWAPARRTFSDWVSAG